MPATASLLAPENFADKMFKEFPPKQKGPESAHGQWRA
jgi:hypothetical protein